MGERLAYLPLIGFAGSLVVGVTGLARRFVGTGRDADAARRVGAGVFLALVVAGYGVRTVVRNRDWHDTLTLFETRLAQRRAASRCTSSTRRRSPRPTPA